MSDDPDRHNCHAKGCARKVSPKLFMCAPHWMSLPKAMRDRIWATYRRGQEIDNLPSAEYQEAAREAVAYIANLEGKA